jgi:HEAT repeat protein
LVQSLQAEDYRRRIVAIQALCENPGSNRVSSLQWVAASDMVPEVVEAAMAALTVVGTTDAANALAGLATDPNRRESAIAALARFPDHALECLRQSMESAGEPLRLTLIEALSRMKRPEATDMIIQALEDPGPAVRLAAIQALTRIGSRRSEARILSLSRTDPDMPVRRAAQQALRIGT